jgi:hypothetical protein
VTARSWREAATQEAQDDLDGLLNFTLPFAQEMLDDAGEFYPFGAAVDAHDEVRLLSGGPDLGEHPASTEVLAVLLNGLRNERDVLRAAAVVSDVRLADTDAVRVELEHRDGHALEVYLPYRKKRFLRGVDYFERTDEPGTRRIWV